MGEIRPGPSEKASFLLGALCRDDFVLMDYISRFNEFKDPSLTSPPIPFDFTEYYSASMGAPLVRRFFLYPPGFEVETLPDLKLRTNELERQAAEVLGLEVSRPVNLDPGYLTLSKLVLASTKDHMHRIYLRDGIFAEITLHYHDRSFRPWPWTFPDYASERYIRFFNQAREKLLRKA